MARSRTTTAPPAARLCETEESRVVRELMGKLGDKWSILLVVMLSKAPGHRARFSELQRMLTGISQRVLTTTLRDIERDGFVSREVFPEVPPRVEYELTDLGLALLEPMDRLARWIGDHWPSIAAARERFDRRA